MECKIRLAIVSPNRDAYSETFIKAHYERIEFKNYFYSGGFLPEYCNNNKLLPMDIFNRTTRFIIKFAFKKKLNFFLKRALKRSLRNNKIDAILAEYGPTGVALKSIAYELRIPMFVFFHGQDASKTTRLEKNKDGYLEICENSKGIFLASETLADNLRKLGCSDKRFIINPYQPNDIFFDNKPKFNNKNIVAVGRFTYKKAPHLSILAFQKVIKNNPEAKLFMVGDGILFESCVNLVKALKIEKSVHFLGVLKTCEIKSLFQKSSIFIQHSVTPISGDQEGSPVAILEASAAGLPIVSTKHSGIMQSVINAKTGFLVDEFDIYSMSERINMLLNDRNMAKKYGDNARKHIRENYLSHFITIENYIKDKIL